MMSNWTWGMWCEKLRTRALDRTNWMFVVREAKAKIEEP